MPVSVPFWDFSVPLEMFLHSAILGASWNRLWKVVGVPALVYCRPLKITFSVQSLAATSHCAWYLWYQRASCWMGLSRVLGSQWDHFCSFKPCLVPSFCGVWHCHQACLFGFWAANGLSLTGALLYSGAWFSASFAVLLQVCLSFSIFQNFLDVSCSLIHEGLHAMELGERKRDKFAAFHGKSIFTLIILRSYILEHQKEGDKESPQIHQCILKLHF